MGKQFSYTSQQITVTATNIHTESHYEGSYIQIGSLGSTFAKSFTYTLPSTISYTDSTDCTYEDITISMTARYTRLYETGNTIGTYSYANPVNTSFRIYQHNALNDIIFHTTDWDELDDADIILSSYTSDSLTIWTDDSLYLKVPFTPNAYNKSVNYYKNTNTAISLANSSINTNNSYYCVKYDSVVNINNTAHVKFVSQDPVGSSTREKHITCIDPQIQCAGQVTYSGTVNLAMDGDNSSFKDYVKYSIQSDSTGSGTITNNNIFTASSAGRVTIVATSLLGGTRTRDIIVLGAINDIDMVTKANYGEIIELKWTGNGGNAKLKYWGDINITLYEGQSERNPPINNGFSQEGDKKVFSWGAVSGIANNGIQRTLYVHISNTNKFDSQDSASFNFEIECDGVTTPVKTVTVNAISIEIS